MKSVLNSTKWKTDPRAAYIPPAFMAFFMFVICMASAPAWSFESYHGHIDGVEVMKSKEAALHRKEQSFKTPSPSVQVDTCLPLLSSTMHPHLPNRTQRSAGKAAAVGLIFGVRFALSQPKTKVNSVGNSARLGLWGPKTIDGSRSALAVSAYRECQKDKALQALTDFRWKR